MLYVRKKVPVLMADATYKRVDILFTYSLYPQTYYPQSRTTTFLNLANFRNGNAEMGTCCSSNVVYPGRKHYLVHTY